MDDTVKDPEMAKRVFGWPLLAIVPFIPGKREGDTRAGTLVCHLEPKSAAAEAFRSLRTAIHYSAINRPKKVLLVTSSFPGEGKTTISANLAVVLAQTGARVLLVGCDLRRPTLHELFGNQRTPGLVELLSGDADLASVRHDTGIANFDFISAGTTPPNPAELLGSEQMRQLLQSLGEQYDHVVIDAPPSLAVTDAQVLTTMADLAVVVLETGRVPLKAARHLQELLSSVKAPVAGLILNDKSRQQEGYYGSYGGYGYYGGYYGDDEGTAKGKKGIFARILGRD
jgi:tyrosine-protein kinase Etk/Wzc